MSNTTHAALERAEAAAAELERAAESAREDAAAARQQATDLKRHIQRTEAAAAARGGYWSTVDQRSNAGLLVGVDFTMRCLVEGVDRPHRGRAVWGMSTCGYVIDCITRMHLECMSCGNTCDFQSDSTIDWWRRNNTWASSCGCRMEVDRCGYNVESECGKHPAIKLAAGLSTEERRKIDDQMQCGRARYVYGDGAKNHPPSERGGWGLVEFAGMPPAEMWAYHE